MKTRVLLVILALGSMVIARAKGQGSSTPDTVVVQSGALKLPAVLWRPNGAGPFPAVLFNHGSGHAAGADASVFAFLDRRMR